MYKIYRKSIKSNPRAFYEADVSDITMALKEPKHNVYVVYKGQLLQVTVVRSEYVFTRVTPEGNLKVKICYNLDRFLEFINTCDVIYDIAQTTWLIDIIIDYS